MKTNVIFNMQEDTCSMTHVGNVRKQNEDNLGYAETPNGDVFVVCDGMGGHVGGKVASSVAVDAIMEYFGSEKKLNITDAMDEAIRYANRRIFEKADAEPELKGMGTTIVLVVIQEDKTYIAHVGDSRIYLFSDNKLFRLTKDHSHVQQLIDIGAITPEEAETHPRKNIILKALGTQPDVEPEVAPEPLLLKNGDTLLMCSDGLSDMVNDKTIEEVLRKGNDVKSTGEELMQLALNAGGKDNITLQLIRITGSNYKESVFVDKTNKPKPAMEDTDPEKTPVPEEPLSSPDEKESFWKRFTKGKMLFILAGILITGAGVFAGIKYLTSNSEQQDDITFDEEIPQESRLFAFKEDGSGKKEFTSAINDSVTVDDFIEEFTGNGFVYDSVNYDLIVVLTGGKIKTGKQKDKSFSFAMKMDSNNVPVLVKKVKEMSKGVLDSLGEITFIIQDNSIERVPVRDDKENPDTEVKDSVFAIQTDSITTD